MATLDLSVATPPAAPTLGGLIRTLDLNIGRLASLYGFSLTNFTPPDGGPIAPTDSIAFSATGTRWTPQLGAITIFGIFPGYRANGQYIFDGGTFQSASYPGGTNTATQTATGVDFVLQRDPLWPTDFALVVATADPSGADVFSVAQYGLSPAVTPGPVLTWTTAAGNISPTAPVVFHLQDATATIGQTGVFAAWLDGTTSAVYDGSGFVAPFDGSTRTGTGTPGDPYIFTVTSDPVWPQNFTLRVDTTDAEGASTSGTRAFTPNPPVVMGPVISATPGLITNTGVLVFQVADATAELDNASVVVQVQYADGSSEIVFAGGVLQPLYADTTDSGSPPATPKVVTVRRSVPWSKNPRLFISINDVQGKNAQTTTGYWTVSDPVSGGPTIENLSPADLTQLQPDQPLVFDLVDSEGALRLAAFSVKLPGNPKWESPWDGAIFSQQYDASSRLVMSPNRWRFVLRRDTGWQTPRGFDGPRVALALQAADANGEIAQ